MGDDANWQNNKIGQMYKCILSTQQHHMAWSYICCRKPSGKKNIYFWFLVPCKGKHTHSILIPSQHLLSAFLSRCLLWLSGFHVLACLHIPRLLINISWLHQFKLLTSASIIAPHKNNNFKVIYVYNLHLHPRNLFVSPPSLFSCKLSYACLKSLLIVLLPFLAQVDF